MKKKSFFLYLIVFFAFSFFTQKGCASEVDQVKLLIASAKLKSKFNEKTQITLSESDRQSLRATLEALIENNGLDEYNREVINAFENCYEQLAKDCNSLDIEDLLKLIPIIIKFIKRIDIIKAPRLDAPEPGNGAISGCGSCCDIGQILALLAAIRSQLTIIDNELIACCDAIMLDFQATWSILANLTVTATVDLNPVFSVITECCNGTFSVLSNLTITTTTDLSGVFSSLAACCNGTFSALANLQITASTDLSGVFSTLTACCNATFSTLANLQFTSTTDLSGIFSVLANLTITTSTDLSGVFTALTSCCNGTFSALADIKSSLTGIQVNLNPVFTALASGFNSTFSILASLTNCCAGTFSILDTIIINQQGTFSALTRIDNEVAGTFSVLNQILLDEQGTFSGLAACCNGTFSVLADIRSSLTGIQLNLSPAFTAMAAGFDGTFSMLNKIDNEVVGTFSVLADISSSLTGIQLNLSAVFTAMAAGFNGTFSMLNKIDNEVVGTFSVLADISSSLTGIQLNLSAVFTAMAAGFNGTFSMLNRIDNEVVGTFSVLNQILVNNQGTFSVLSTLSLQPVFTAMAAGFNGTFSSLAAISLQPVFTVAASGFNGTFSMLTRLDQDNCSPTYITQETVGPIGGAQTPVTINTPGVYKLASNIVYTPGGAGTQLIVINSSGVTLDLSCFTITQQGGGVVATDGIRVNSGFSDIIIKNGMISDFTGRGITVQSNVQRILIADLSIVGCDIRGMEFLGGATKSSIVNGTIRNCNIFQGLTDSAADRALYLQSCTDFQITNCRINGNGVTTVTQITPVSLDNCLKISAQGLTIDDNIGNNVTGVHLFNATIQSIFQDCLVRNNMALGNARGFFLESNSSSTSNQFLNCTAMNLSGTAAIDGFLTGTGCNDNLFMNCKALQNISTGAGTVAVSHGFNFIGCSRNSVYDSVAQGNAAAASTAPIFCAFGFELNTTSSVDLIRCTADDQIGTTGANPGSVGFRVINGTGAATNTNVVRDCEASNQSVGFQVDPSTSVATTNVFMRNASIKNGSNYNGFSATAIQTAPNINSINSLTVPWTNAAIG